MTGPGIRLIQRRWHNLRHWLFQRHWPKLPPLPGGSRLWVALASLGFVLAALLNNGRQLAQLSLDAQGWAWLLLGVGVSLLSLVANGLAWGLCLRWLGLTPAWGATVLLFLASNLRKYLPGGIWHLVQRIQVLRGGGVVTANPQPAHRAVLAVLLDPVLMAAAALALVPLGLWPLQGADWLALLALLPLLALAPRWFRPLLGALERRRMVQLSARLPEDEALKAAATNQQVAEAASPLLSGYPLVPLLAELVFVLLRFGGFACCVLAFDQQLSLGWGHWLAGFALAWTAGLVVPGAPGGLGVFEATLLLRLGLELPEGPLLAIALSYRLVTVVADLLAAGTAHLDQRWWARTRPRAWSAT